MTCTASIESALSAANGRRRTRTADIDDVNSAIREAQETGWCIRVYGCLPNSYKYRAYATVVSAVRRLNGDVVVTITEGNAVRRAGGGNGWVTVRRMTEAGRVDRLDSNQLDTLAQSWIDAGSAILVAAE